MGELRQQIVDAIRRSAKSVASALKWQRSAFKNAAQPVPVYGAKTAPGLKIHLGAGEINLQGWINVDARGFGHIHSQTSSLDLREFTDGAVGVVYMCHVLEHVSFVEAEALLSALRAKLTVGGELMISVPDFDSIIEIYLASGRDLDSVKFALMGGQGYEYNFHKSVYTAGALIQLLQQCGYQNARRWTPVEEFGSDIGDWSSAVTNTSRGPVALSLNIKAVNPGPSR